MDLRAGAHPDEESLEKYLLGSLDPLDAKQIEEHLLTCQMCREKGAALKDYIQAMRKALATEPPKTKAARKGKPSH
jgi:anti-sigma factor RsiW